MLSEQSEILYISANALADFQIVLPLNVSELVDEVFVSIVIINRTQSIISWFHALQHVKQLDSNMSAIPVYIRHIYMWALQFFILERYICVWDPEHSLV